MAGESCAAGIECCPDLVCVDGACTDLPSTCADTCDGCCAGEACEPGTADNACGIDGESCQACAEPTPVCGAQEPGVCGCVPTTCAAQNAQCGPIADGCGDTLQCGTCPAPQVCVDHQCVTPCGDVCASGCQFTSLQQAIDDPDGPTTIRLCAETYQETVTIDKNLTLLGMGDGEDGTILDGDNAGTVVRIAPTFTVEIRDLTITGGNSSNPGGGIFSDGATLTLTACTVSGNTANLFGGGICNLSGAVTLTTCTVMDNTAGATGGGVFNDSGGTLTLTDSTVDNNVASGAHGGGIANANTGSVTLNGTSRVTNNRGLSLGGGIHNNRGTFTLNDSSSVSGNVCVSTGGGDGGGIYNLSGTVILNDTSSVTENTANGEGGGGGILNDGQFGGGTSSCSGGSSVSGNTPNDCVEVNGGDCGTC